MYNRVEWVDTAKGYGILLVIIGHLSTPYITSWLYTFHIPLFFFLSGYVFNKKKCFHDFFRGKLKHLIIPYLCLALPMAFFDVYLSSGKLLCKICLWNELTSYLIQIRCSTLWFVACLFILNLIFYIIIKLNLSEILNFIIVVILTMIGLLYWHFDGKPLPWNIDISFIVLPFFYLGYYMKRNDHINLFLFGKKQNGVFLFFIIVNVVVGLINFLISGYKVDLYYNKIGVVPLAYISALSGIFMMIFISKKVTISGIRYIGRNSLLYFAWHVTIIMPCMEIFYNHFGLFNGVTSLYEVLFRDLVSLFIILFVLTILNLLIDKSKLRFIIGK